MQTAESEWVLLLPRTDGLTTPNSSCSVIAPEGSELIPSPVLLQELCQRFTWEPEQDRWWELRETEVPTRKSSPVMLGAEGPSGKRGARTESRPKGGIITPSSQKWKPRLREARSLAQSHTARKWQSWDPKSSLPKHVDKDIGPDFSWCGEKVTPTSILLEVLQEERLVWC